MELETQAVPFSRENIHIFDSRGTALSRDRASVLSKLSYEDFPGLSTARGY